MANHQCSLYLHFFDCCTEGADRRFNDCYSKLMCCFTIVANWIRNLRVLAMCCVRSTLPVASSNTYFFRTNSIAFWKKYEIFWARQILWPLPNRILVKLTMKWEITQHLNWFRARIGFGKGKEKKNSCAFPLQRKSAEKYTQKNRFCCWIFSLNAKHFPFAFAFPLKTRLNLL